MKYKNRAVAWILAAMLLVSGALALVISSRASRKAASGKVQITELCAKNETVLADNSGKFRDYIEIYAPSQ